MVGRLARLMSVAVLVAFAVVTAGGEAWAKNWNTGGSETSSRQSTTTIKTGIENALKQNGIQSVNVIVKKGSVLLTGFATTPEDKIKATLLAWWDPNIDEVVDEIKVIDASSTQDLAKDLATSATLRGRLIADTKVDSLRFNIHVLNGEVYLSGRARTEAEKNSVVSHAQSTRFAKIIRNYIFVGDQTVEARFIAQTDYQVCRNAVSNGKWEVAPKWVEFVSEAKRRGLTCGVNEIQNISNVDLCKLARTPSIYGGWEPEFGPKGMYVQEAKRRGLSCGVDGVETVTGSGVKIASPTPTDVCKEINSQYSEYGYEHETLKNLVNRAIRERANCQNTYASARKIMALTMKSDIAVCNQATIQIGTKNYWLPESTIMGLEAVFEARRRGLTCGVGETTQTATSSNSNQPKAPTSAALLAAERKARELEQQLAALKAEQEQRQQTISSDTQKPIIRITNTSSKGPQGTVQGRVADNTGIAEVRVDGQLVQVDGSGNFTFNTYVPDGGKAVKVEAIDLAGLASSMTARLGREMASNSNVLVFDSLNPLKRRVANNKNALALIIGLETYEKTDAKAAYADSDAKVFADYAALKLGIPQARIKTLLNDDADIADVLLSVQDWLSRAIKQGQSDVYIFFAGHGLASEDGEQMYLLPYDGSPRLLQRTAILRDELFADIASANPRSVTVFLDTCYSGTTRGTDMLIASRPIAIKAIQKSIPKGFTVMTAAAGDQTAKPLEEAKHGMFSYFLMKGMEGDADANNDNQITAGELHQYVQQNVVQQSSGSQTPELQGDAERVLVRFE